MSHAYRSAYDHIVGLKLEDAREAREHLRPRLAGLRGVVHARISRILGGGAGIVGAVVMCFYACTTSDESATEALVFGAIALAGSWLLARGAFGLSGKFVRETPEPALTGELDRDLNAIEARDLRRELRIIEHEANALETASVAVPMIGLTFIVPLFLHWLFALVFMREMSTNDYATWIRISLVIVGHAHLALALCSYLFARKVHRADLEKLAQMRITNEWAKSWGITIGVSCLPGLLLIAVPPLLVAITAVAFVPLMFIGLRKAVLGERILLAAAHRENFARIEALVTAPLIPDPRVAPALSAEQEQREADGHDEHGAADAGDRAQA